MEFTGWRYCDCIVKKGDRNVTTLFCGLCSPFFSFFSFCTLDWKRGAVTSRSFYVGVDFSD